MFNSSRQLPPLSSFAVPAMRVPLPQRHEDAYLWNLPPLINMGISQIPVASVQSDDDDDEGSNIWAMCQEITLKKGWYQKIFNTDIVNRWRDEMPEKSYDDFDFAVKLLQTTTQGSIHLPDCNWEGGRRLCDICLCELKEDILNNPEMYDLTPEEIGDDFFSDNWEYDFEEYKECNHIRCSCTAPDSGLLSYVDYHPDGVVSDELHQQCKRIITDMAEKEPIDYHPGSNNQVRDLIHPSMYCYVKGVSKHTDGSISEDVDESERYQWLPSEFIISDDGHVTVNSYINNLNHEKYPEFIPTISQVFERFIPSLEHILKRNIHNKSLQVIVKVGNIILTPDNPNFPSGSWHIEGMPYEHIAATCIHYVDVNNTTPSFLEFRKPTIINEDYLDYPQNDNNYTQHHYGIENHHDGVMNRYLGLILCHEGASVVFPNTLQHRVKIGRASCRERV